MLLLISLTENFSSSTVARSSEKTHTRWRGMEIDHRFDARLPESSFLHE